MPPDPATTRLTELLGSLTNYERQRPDRPRWSLDNARVLLSRPAAVLPRGPIVQVGGSKGKGTTALYLESLGAAAGLRVGTYLSPHLQSLLERVRVCGCAVEEQELRDALVGVLDFARDAGVATTFFEVMTAAALSCFAAHDLDLTVLEVGLGGRLDATTAVPVQASIVTSIELEHTELLGGTLEEIAGEKAFVIRAGRPAFTSARGVALRVLERHADHVGADLRVLGRDFELSDVREENGGYHGSIEGLGVSHQFWMPGASEFELPALALAVACTLELFPDACLQLDPVPRPELPGRCEILTCGDGEPLVLDGAHTESSMRALASELERRFPGRPVAVLFASAGGKRWRESLKCLLSMADTFIVTALTDTPSERPDAILSWLSEHGARAETVATIDDGMERLSAHRAVRVVTGSFFIAGAARSRLGILGVPEPA